VNVIWRDFREFAVRGNVVDLAVAVTVGGAFGRTTSLVSDIVMPPIGLLLGRVSFANLYLKNRQPAKAGGPTTRACPYCLTSLPLKATRCWACTSRLPEPTVGQP